MKITLFGLTLSSSWGNGHATPYRAILRALHRLGHRITFYERDVPYYARHRDLWQCAYCDLKLYSSWDDIRSQALAEAAESDVVVTASYVPEGARIADALLSLHGPLRVFYDLDTPITLQRLAEGDLDYLRAQQLAAFDLVLSWTGGDALIALQRDFGVKMARPLFGCVDPDVYRPVLPRTELRCELSYMGTYAADRQAKLESMFLEPARQSPSSRFLLAGPLYPRVAMARERGALRACPSSRTSCALLFVSAYAESHARGDGDLRLLSFRTILRSFCLWHADNYRLVSRTRFVLRTRQGVDRRQRYRRCPARAPAS